MGTRMLALLLVNLSWQISSVSKTEMGWLASCSLLPVAEVCFRLHKEQLEFYSSPALEARAAWMNVLYRDDRSLEGREHPRLVDRTNP